MKDLTNSYRDPSKKYNQQQQIVVEGEKRSLTPEPNKIPRRSHVSLSSNMRTSVSVSKVKHGPFRRACPAMPRQLAFICFILNIILPGTGKN
ncbi:unnamed protein product [Didymodactylos carnosus]|uniref:Uncharacterized protein n=1 Tax=Didymodactylos carnosus TaxID=1234261 RepID=A0A815GY36_9BILA|nr:unnamed protein product [Didymodactylos carnosus]CAF4208318.1 unnamed protein product [Didymodactylos carnosus]